MFSVQDGPIQSDALLRELDSLSAGARVIFEGSVRNHNEGHTVVSLEYEIFTELALKEGNKILQEAKEKFDLIQVRACHRQGKIALGENAVWVGVSCAHRKEAFKACRFIIDELKVRLPIWKKEFYADKSSAWVNCQGCTHNHYSANEKIEYYSRQKCLPELSSNGQNFLNNAKVLVVGAGGLGVPALTYLAAAGVGSIVICDSDRVEISNLHRQTIYQYEDIGKLKAVVAQKRLAKLNPFIKIVALTDRFTPHNAENLVGDSDVVLDCCDNFTTKFLLNDACYFFHKKLVSASIYTHEGNLICWDFSLNQGCMRCLWPSIPEDGCTGTCAEVGVLGATVGIFGSMQAMEALKFIISPNKVDTKHLTLFNLMSHDFLKIEKTKNNLCPLCGTNKVIFNISAKNYQPDTSCTIEPTALNFASDYFVDIREKHELISYNNFSFKSNHMPMSNFNEEKINPNNKTILFCQTGKRSLWLSKSLRSKGFLNVYSLNGGVKHLLSENHVTN